MTPMSPSSPPCLPGLISFLSPCVLPLVPPYLVYLAGTSLERLADDEPEPRVRARDGVAALPVRGRLLHGVRRARRQRQRRSAALLRAYSEELSIVAGIAIIVMGLHFLGLTPYRAAAAREAR